jgi:uncharacterized protein YgiB involved in biofilm formation
MRTKRSKSIHLVLLATTSLAVTGCDNSPKGETVQEDVTFVEPGKCTDVGVNPDGTGVRTYTPEYCAQAEKDALAEFEKTAPVYAYREECIAQHGEDACKGEMKVVERDGQRQSGYMPAFAGFVVGSAAALAAAHIFHTMSGNAQGRVARPVPVYSTLNDTCRGNPNGPGCRTGSGGSAGGGRAGYAYGYNGYTVAQPSATNPGRMTTTVNRTSTGAFAPVSTARAGFGGTTSGVGATARGGFGATASAHGSGGG